MIVVIGATGYVGRYLCSYFKDKNIDVLALGRSKKVQVFFEENKIPFQYFDINDDRCFDQLPENIEAVIDLSACLAEHETPVEDFFKINTIGVYKVLEFAKRRNIKRVVVTTSHKVYNDFNVPNATKISEDISLSYRGDHTPYIISKIAAENFIEYYNKDFGMEAIALRLTGVHGYGEVLGHLDKDGHYKKSTFEIFFESALEGKDIHVWGDQSIKRDHIYIKDVLSAIEAATYAKGAKGIFNIASGVGFSQYEEACVLAKVFGKGNISNVILEPTKPGLNRGYVYDISKAKLHLGWEPKYTDLTKMYEDYKLEWQSKKFHNYHFVLEDEMPLTF